jgi:hypothetical protein
MLSKPPASHPDTPFTRRGFALTLLTRTRNPSQLARAMYLSPKAAPHAMLSGDEAESVGEELGVQPVDPSYFFTEQRWKEHRRGLGLPDGPYPPGQGPGKVNLWSSWTRCRLALLGRSHWIVVGASPPSHLQAVKRTRWWDVSATPHKWGLASGRKSGKRNASSRSF